MSNRDDIGAALGRIPSGCSILTTQHEGRSTGVLVSWVQQAAFEPPSLTVCLRQGRPAVDLIQESDRFLLNIIGQDSVPVFRHFGKGFTIQEDAFAGLEVDENEFGPLLPLGIAHLGCTVSKSLDVGDHRLFLAEVKWGRAATDAKPYTHLRKNGFSY